MYLDLIDAELANAASACRVMAYQQEERAKELRNPTTRGLIEALSQHYARLAQKLETVRERRSPDRAMAPGAIAREFRRRH